MGVYRDKKVPVPKGKGITINRGDNNRVLYTLSAPYDNKAGYARPKRITIGHVCPDDTKVMYPTDKYKTIFPGDWEKFFHEKPDPIIKKMGMYALGQAVNAKIGIYDVLSESLGVSAANNLMDYALYSVLYHSDVASQFETRMGNQILYSGKAYSDTYYSNFFEKEISKDDVFRFKKNWVLQCRRDGIDEVWLCIDGSNDDCESKGVELAEKGHAKSRKNVDIVSFTYAVTTNGFPVTFEVYRGGLVDAKAMQTIIDFLNGCGIKVKGVILDRGYCNARALRYLDSKNIAYIIMVKGQPAGFEEMVAEYGNKIKMNAEWLIEGTNLFGIQKECQLFDNYKKNDFVTLFYDLKNGTERVEKLLKNLYQALDEARQKLTSGKKVGDADNYHGMLNIGETSVAINRPALQEAIDEKGLYSIVSSEEMTPAQVNALYAARNVSETQYMFIKTQLGYGKVRIHFTQGVHSRFLTGFIASVIRFEIERASSGLQRNATESINEMNLLEMTNLNGTYAYVHIENYRQVQLLKNLNSGVELLDEVVADENDRISGVIPTPRHRKPGPKKNKAVREKEKPKPGPKPGFKRTELKADGTPRQKPGPKPGMQRGEFNKDGSRRQKPGPKSGSKQIR